jgi:hypothetical protein
MDVPEYGMTDKFHYAAVFCPICPEYEIFSSNKFIFAIFPLDKLAEK